MQSNDNNLHTYHLNVNLPRLAVYSVEEILAIISENKYPDPSQEECDEQAVFFNLYDLDCSEEPTIIADRISMSPLMNQICYERQKYKSYLIDRLFTEVVNGNIKFWNAKLDQVQVVPTHLRERTVWDSSADYWLKEVYIRQETVLYFCNDQNIHILFDDQKDELVTQCLGEKKVSQVTNVKFGYVANYKQLANAFIVCDKEDDNFEWFKERCSNIDKYPAFLSALHERGKRGRGNFSTFNVVQIAAYLNEKQNVTVGKLRSGVEKYFPKSISLFDDYVGQCDLN